jgi:hypothetical protein
MDSSDSRRARPGDRRDRGHGGGLISRALATRSSARSRRRSRRSRYRAPSRIFLRWSPALSGSHSSRSQARSPPPRRLPPAVGGRNGEMIAIVAPIVSAGFFQGFPVSTSGSRTAVAEQAGSRTQVGCGRSGTDRAYPRDRVWAAQEPARPHARCGRHRRIAVPGRSAGEIAAVASA